MKNLYYGLNPLIQLSLKLVFYIKGVQGLKEREGPFRLEAAAWTKAPSLDNVGRVCVTNSSGSNWLERILGKLAEECENVGRQWGTIGYSE